MLYVRRRGTNEKLLNQLLSLAVYENPSLARQSQNLLETSLLYYTLYQTSEAERKRNERDENSKDPNQVALDKFLAG